MAAPDVPLHRLEILGAEERRTLLEGFNATAREVPEASLPALFEAQVARTPEAVAVVFGEEIAELWGAERARQPAGASSDWAGRGAGERWSASRSSAQRRDGGGAAGRAQVRRRLPAARPVLSASAAGLHHQRMPLRRWCSAATRIGGVSSHMPVHNPPRRLRPRHPAYVNIHIGVDGEPKGVVVEHGSLSAFIAAITEHVGFDAGYRQAAVTTMAFDISIMELLLPLCHGAGVVIASREEARDPQKLSELVRRQRINSCRQRPSQLGIAGRT